MRASRMRHACAWLVFSFLLTSTAAVSAQSTGGRIAGKVIDSSGASLAAVQVSLINEASGVIRNTVTNESGAYSFPEAPVGTYRIEFDVADRQGRQEIGLRNPRRRHGGRIERFPDAAEWPPVRVRAKRWLRPLHGPTPQRALTALSSFP